jgi:O-antigen/teichoic acid export membrane protein
MYKQSAFILIIKVIEISVSFISLLIVTSNMSPVIYSLIGIKIIYDGAMILLTNLGFEDIFIRNYLSWKQVESQLSNIYYTYIIRTKKIINPIIFLILVLVSFTYFNLIFKGESIYLIVLIYYAVTSVIVSYSNSFKLILRGVSNFLVIHISSLVFVTLYRVLILIVFLRFGNITYLFLLPIGECIQLVFLYCYSIKKYKFKEVKINIKEYFNKVRVQINYIRQNYINFGRHYLDKIIVSLLFSPTIFATYSLSVQIENILTTSLESFADPLIQKSVEFKNHNPKLVKYSNNLYKARRLGIPLFLVGLLTYILIGQKMINIIGLNDYEYLFVFGLFVIIILFITLEGILEKGFVTLLFESKYRLFISIIGVISIIPFFFVGILPEYLAYGTRVLSTLILVISIKIVFYRKGGLKNEENIHSDV